MVLSQPHLAHHRLPTLAPPRHLLPRPHLLGHLSHQQLHLPQVRVWTIQAKCSRSIQISGKTFWFSVHSLYSLHISDISVILDVKLHHRTPKTFCSPFRSNMITNSKPAQSTSLLSYTLIVHTLDVALNLVDNIISHSPFTQSLWC